MTEYVWLVFLHDLVLGVYGSTESACARMDTYRLEHPGNWRQLTPRRWTCDGPEHHISRLEAIRYEVQR